MRFAIDIRKSTLLAVALFTACIAVPGAFASDQYANISVDTSTLSGSVAEVVFVLTGAKQNNVSLSNFTFGGGSAGTVDSNASIGNAFGNLSSSISISDGPFTFTNVFAQRFTAGSTLSFHMVLSAIQDA